MVALEHGPNIVATSAQVEKQNRALKNLSDDQIKKCEKLLLEGGNSLTALVVGESGTGKSTFINTFLGKEIAKVDSGPTEVTRKVKHYTGRVGNVDTTVVEVPELDTGGIRKHRKELKRYCPNGVDVVFVCQKMYDRHRPSAIKTLRCLSIAFSREIHKKAVFVMTFANDIPRSWERKTDKKTLQEKLEKDWCDQADAIRADIVKELKMSRKDAEKISVLPAGYYDEDDPESKQILGVTSDWINDIKLAAANASQTAIPAILKVIASPLNTNNSCGGRGSSGGHSSSGGCDSSGESEDRSGGFFGLMSKHIQLFAACVKDVAMTVLDKICSLVKKVASTVFNAMKVIADAVQKAFTAVYESGALTGVVAGVAVSGAVAAAVMGGVTGIVIGTVVIAALSVVLIRLFGFLAGIAVLAGAAVGSTAGAGIGMIVGGILGSIIPGAGTAAGVGIGALVGGSAGAICGGAIGGGAAAAAFIRKYET